MTRVMARIDQLRTQLGVPAPGQFDVLLGAQLGAGSVSPTMMSTRPSTSTPIQTIPVTPPTGPAGPTAADLERYLTENRIRERNGRLSESELTPVSGGWDGRSMTLLAPAAEQWEAMRAAAARDGIDLRLVDAYRSYEVQAAAYEDYLAARKNANVLPPGTSEHGVGLAVDVTNGAIIGEDDPEWAWMQANARRFGWHPISNETWHWEYRGV